MSDVPSAVDAPKPKLPLKKRLAALYEEYGTIAIVTYLVMGLLTWAAFATAFGLGVEPSSASGVLGVIGAGWVAGKATMPIRIPIAIAITPVVARVWRKWRGPKKAPLPELPLDEDEEAELDEA